MSSRYLWFTLPLAMLAAGCGQPTATPLYVTNFDKLKVGMPRLTAQELLGEPYRADYNKSAPASVSSPAGGSSSEREEMARTLGGGQPGWSERWQYGRFNLGDVADLLAGSDKAFIVYFDQNAAVISFRKPLAGPFAAASQPAAKRRK